MNTKQELYEQEKQKYADLSDELGLIWAFSNDQFDEQSTKGVKYASIGGGGFIPSANIKLFTEGMFEIDKWSKQAKKMMKG